MSLSRQIIFSGLLFCALPYRVQAYDTMISASGNIVGNGCTIATDSKNLNVPLGEIGMRNFTISGNRISPAKSFFINLEDCSSTFRGVRVLFIATPDPHNPQYIKVDEGGASGVAIQLLDKNEDPVALNTHTPTYGLTGEDTVQIKFYARLIATEAQVNAGAVSAVATWMLEYQ
ncbi:fimbrial protein [Mixta intestinalis]|uniref:S-fimbrial protein subunit SfaG n=1 Tax=Mixta intestinalis TaxID=1615494 RepID=A0A6P1PVU0_9GAMM|nr:fimbrial protein [Mixta intestinalis]QHM70231.1 S-fimbrial protein subunit SfaG [Mixta intestinalis]